MNFPESLPTETFFAPTSFDKSFVDLLKISFTSLEEFRERVITSLTLKLFSFRMDWTSLITSLTNASSISFSSSFFSIDTKPKSNLTSTKSLPPLANSSDLALHINRIGSFRSFTVALTRALSEVTMTLDIGHLNFMLACCLADWHASIIFWATETSSSNFPSICFLLALGQSDCNTD